MLRTDPHRRSRTGIFPVEGRESSHAALTSHAVMQIQVHGGVPASFACLDVMPTWTRVAGCDANLGRLSTITTPTASMTVVVVGNEGDSAPGDVIISFVMDISSVIVSTHDFIMG